MQYEEVVDAYAFVTFMRSQRNYMIQTEEQYRFLYEVLNEAIEFRETEVTADRFLFHVTNLLTVHSKTGISEMQMEFKKLQSSFMDSNHTLRTSTQKSKSRLLPLTPSDENKLISPFDHSFSDSELASANFVNSYKDRKAFVAAESPLSGTTDEFWKMLWESKSSVVVMIVKPKENGKITCHQYWPEGRSVRYKYFVVDPVAQYNMPFFVLREFKVTDARDGQSRVIRQFHYIEWPEHGVPSSGEGLIEFIGHIQKTKQQFGLGGPVTVHCSQGDDRTGICIAVNNVLERLKYEGIIDIFQTVKLVHAQRPHFFPTEEQYRFCYQVVLEYLSSFDHIVS